MCLKTLLKAAIAIAPIPGRIRSPGSDSHPRVPARAGMTVVRTPAWRASRSRSARRRAGSGVVSATAALLVQLACGSSPVSAAGSTALDGATEIEPFVAGVEERHGVAADEVRALLADARVLDAVLKAIQRPAERKPWHEYRKIFLTEKRITRGAEFWREHSDALVRASERFGVPPEIVVAIIGVESFYGTYRGRHRVLDALATLGFRYPKRSAFFLSELEQFVLLAREERLDPRRVTGSYAGAMGIAQFISSSYRRYAIDFDGDGSRDLMQSPEDAIGSIANYLSVHGWSPGAAIAVRPKSKGVHSAYWSIRGSSRMPRSRRSVPGASASPRMPRTRSREPSSSSRGGTDTSTGSV